MWPFNGWKSEVGAGVIKTLVGLFCVVVIVGVVLGWVNGQPIIKKDSDGDDYKVYESFFGTGWEITILQGILAIIGALMLAWMSYRGARNNWIRYVHGRQANNMFDNNDPAKDYEGNLGMQSLASHAKARLYYAWDTDAVIKQMEQENRIIRNDKGVIIDVKPKWKLVLNDESNIQNNNAGDVELEASA